MNRREFLQSLAAIGTAIAIDPAALAKATEAEVEVAWQAVTNDPRIFYVSEYGTISSGFGPQYPTTRRELLGLPSPGAGRDELLEYLDLEAKAGQHVEFLFECAQYDDDVGDAGDWREWLVNGDDELIDQVAWQLEQWLDDHADEQDWQFADLHGLSDRGDALQFFRYEGDTADLFNIVIVEGDHPGSSYFAAELRMDVQDANAVAVAEGIPIRFEHDGGDL